MSDHPLNILKWLAEAGDDIAIGDVPIDRFAQSAEQREKSKTQQNERTNSTRADIAARAKAVTNRSSAKEAERTERFNKPNLSIAPSEEIIAEARKLALESETLDALRKALEAFEGCNLKRGAKNLVFGSGNPQANIMFVGKAPEMDEDLEGKSFSGASGEMMDKMLAAIGLSRESTYLINIVPWHTPGGRSPTPAECEICKPFIERHIELVAPNILVLVGNDATKTLLNTKEHLIRVRGSWKEITLGTHQVQAVATLHPSYLMKNPAQKALAWQDLLSIKAKLAEQ